MLSSVQGISLRRDQEMMRLPLLACVRSRSIIFKVSGRSLGFFVEKDLVRKDNLSIDSTSLLLLDGDARLRWLVLEDVEGSDPPAGYDREARGVS